MRYKIPEHIKITPVPNNLRRMNSDYNDFFLISDDCSERQFIINQTTKIFIEKFSLPKDFTILNKEIAEEVKAPVDKVKKIIYPFFKYIKHRHFIVRENYVEKKAKTKSLFNCGDLINQYKIEKKIDIKSSIDIYKALDLQSKKNVIVKLLKSSNKERILELEREFAFLKTLNKNGIAPHAYEFISHKDYTYFIQDFIDGLSLPEFIDRRKKSSLKLIVKIAENILSAFTQVHKENVIHGDIHPSNIIVTEENKIKIIDFGLALNSELDKDELVNFGGAYFFMPPERIKITTRKKFLRKPDFYSDVFQLGVVLFMLLYDEYPFEGIIWEELATEIKERQIEFPAISKYNFLVPGWMKDIIAKCVSKKPKLRFADAQQLYNAFSKNINDASKVRSAVKI